MLNQFSLLELACRTTDQVRLAAGFGEALERLRVELDAPISINSACRSPLHNAKISGHPHSLHLIINSHWGTGGTCAVDVAATADLSSSGSYLLDELANRPRTVAR